MHRISDLREVWAEEFCNQPFDLCRDSKGLVYRLVNDSTSLQRINGNLKDKEQWTKEKSGEPPARSSQ